MKKYKYITYVVLAIIIISSSYLNTAYAGDPGENFDDQKLVEFTVEPIYYDSYIGGEIIFSLTIKNNSKFKCHLDQISRIYTGYETPTINLDADISPSKTIQLTLSSEIVNTAAFYKEGGVYYLDYDVRLNYTLADSSDGGYPQYYSYQSNKAKLLINNLKDGSEYINMQYTDNVYEVYLLEDLYSRYYKYSSNIKNDIKLSSLKDKTINNLFVYNNCYLEFIPYITGKDTLTINSFENNKYYTKLSRGGETETYTSYSLWYDTDSYYISKVAAAYPMIKLLPPEIYMYESEAEGGRYKIEIENTSSSDINNLYLNFSYDENDFGLDSDSSYFFPIINAKSSIEFFLDFNPLDIDESFLVGTLYNDKAALWYAHFHVIEYNQEQRFSYGIKYFGFFSVLPETTPEPSYTPNPEVSATAKPSPESTTIKAKKPTSALEIKESVEKESGINIYIIIIAVLVVIVLALGIIIILKLPKNKK